jgi:hypothetical protein
MSERTIPIATAKRWAEMTGNEAHRCYQNLPDGTVNPARFRLWCAYIRCLESLTELFDNGPRPELNEPQLIAAFLDLRSYLFESAMKAREAGSLDNAKDDVSTDLVRSGLSCREAGALIDEALKSRKGRPSERKELYVLACDRHFRGYTYSQIVDELCDCGKAPGSHQEWCIDKFKQGIKDVRRTLDKYERKE